MLSKIKLSFTRINYKLFFALIVLGLGNLAFVLYDIAVSKMALVYIWTVAPKIKKILK